MDIGPGTPQRDGGQADFKANLQGTLPAVAEGSCGRKDGWAWIVSGKERTGKKLEGQDRP